MGPSRPLKGSRGRGFLLGVGDLSAGWLGWGLVLKMGYHGEGADPRSGGQAVGLLLVSRHI